MAQAQLDMANQLNQEKKSCSVETSVNQLGEGNLSKSNDESDSQKKPIRQLECVDGEHACYLKEEKNQKGYGATYSSDSDDFLIPMSNKVKKIGAKRRVNKNRKRAQTGMGKNRKKASRPKTKVSHKRKRKQTGTGKKSVKQRGAGKTKISRVKKPQKGGGKRRKISKK